jgi:hypothetical protein
MRFYTDFDHDVFDTAACWLLALLIVGALTLLTLAVLR